MPKKKRPSLSKSKVDHSDIGAPSNANNICRIPLTAQEHQDRSEPTEIHELSWRIFRIMSEFVDGFQFLSETKKEVTFWGGTRKIGRAHV